MYNQEDFTIRVQPTDQLQLSFFKFHNRGELGFNNVCVQLLATLTNETVV